MPEWTRKIKGTLKIGKFKWNSTSLKRNIYAQINRLRAKRQHFIKKIIRYWKLISLKTKRVLCKIKKYCTWLFAIIRH